MSDHTAPPPPTGSRLRVISDESSVGSARLLLTHFVVSTQFVSRYTVFSFPVSNKLFQRM